MPDQGEPGLRLREHEPLAAAQVRFLVNAIAPDVDARAAAGAPFGRISPTALRHEANGAVHLIEATDPAEADSHAAPEVLAGGAPTVRSEVFSLASTTYTFLTGHPPNPYGFATVRRARPDLSPQVDGALLQATARSPELRFTSATEFAAALSDALSDGDRKLAARPAAAFSPGYAPVVAPAPESPAAEPAPSAPDPSARPERGGNRFVMDETTLSLVFLGLAIVLVVGFMTLFLSGG